MPPRQAINCGEHVAFIITYNRASPSALRYPLWLRPAANANDASSGLSRFRVIENCAPLAQAL